MMRSFKTGWAPLLTVVLVAVPAGAETVEEVVAKHVEARGGDNWGKIETLTITGDYTAFSETHPFTLQRKRDNKYLLESYFVDSRRKVGFDGGTAWSAGDEGPELIEGLDLAILAREADFVTPFFGYRDNGYEVSLVGDTEFDGMNAIGVELKRPDGHSETWYLDPKTYLEMGRISPGNDWLGPVERRTFYDDFREVSGVKIPYYTESQWYTRNRVMEIASVEANVPIEDSVFRMPAPMGMGSLQPMIGDWDVAISVRQRPGDDWQDSTRNSKIERLMRGGLVQETYVTSSGIEVVRTLSYDRFNERYRVTQIDSRRNQLDVKEGSFDDGGKLTVSNVETGTTWEMQGMTFHGRATIFDITEDGFKVEYETSTDGGENWFLNAKASYTRSAEE